MEFELSRWRGVNAILLLGDGAMLEPDRVLPIIHSISSDHIARDLLRSMNADDDSSKPFWTHAESAAWDLRGRIAHSRLDALVFSSVPGRDLSVELAQSDIGYYLSSYALDDSIVFYEALEAMQTPGGAALAWGVMTSATKFVELLAHDSRLSEFLAAGFEDELDDYPVPA